MNSGGSHPLDEREIEQLKLQLTKAEATMLNLEWRLGEAKAAVTEETWRADRAEAALAELRPAAASEDWHREYGRVLVRVMRERDEADRALTQVIFERDRRAEVADSLAESIAEMTGVEIGEHSSENDPWLNAIAAAASGTFDRTRPGEVGTPSAQEGHKPTAYLPDGSPHSETCRACGADWPCSGVMTEREKVDSDLAAINAWVAADKRVLDAAEAQRDAYAAADANLTNEAIVALRAAGKELAAAVDARRALTGEQAESAA